MMKLMYHYDEPQEENLDEVNAALAEMRLGSLEVKNLKGCVSTERKYENEQLVSTRYYFNLMKLELDVEQAQNGYVYSFATEAMPADQAPEHDTYVEAWRRMHPDRIVRIAQSIQYGDSMKVFIIVSHEKSNVGQVTKPNQHSSSGQKKSLWARLLSKISGV